MGYLSYIDGLRAIAVLVIVLFHLDVTWLPGGFIGVDIFFVISGYLITGIIVEDIRNNRFSFLSFYARRIKRIFPALFIMLLFATLGAVMSLGLEAFTDFFRSLRGASVQLSNIYFHRNVDYFSSQEAIPPLLHTWSLGVEEQFYAIWPFLLVFLYKAKSEKLWIPALSLLFITSLALSQHLVQTDPKSAFYMLHSRAWELALGGLVALSPSPFNTQFRKNIAGTLSLAGFALMSLPAFTYTADNSPGLKALLPCLGVAMILYAGRDMNGICQRLLSWRPLVLTGLISYSLYLWHWPLIAFYKLYTGLELTLWTQTVILILSFLCASLSYMFVEQPVRRAKAMPLKVITTGCIVVICFLIAGHFIKKENHATWRVSQNFNPHERAPHDLDQICSIEDGAYNKERCTIGPNPEKYEVILAGDSTASHYTPMILAWAKANGLTVRLFTRSACTTWLKSNNPQRYGHPDLDCKRMTNDFYSILENDKSIRYIFLGKNLPAATPEIEESLAAIRKFNHPVHFLGAGLRFESDPHICNMRKSVLLSRMMMNISHDKNCLGLHPEFYKSQQEGLITFRHALTHHGFHYFDPLSGMQSPYDEQGHFMFLDDYHMNQYGSIHLIPAFMAYMKTYQKH